MSSGDTIGPDNSPRREQLLRYLFGILEPAEREIVERQLADDDELCRQLEQLSNALAALDESEQPEDPQELFPPPGLAERTCEFVFEHEPPSDKKVQPFRSHLRYCEPTQPIRRGWSLADMVVAVGVFFAAAMLFFPAVANSRYQARVAACQNNLQNLHLALANYSQYHRGYFPEVPSQGKFAAAGIYAPALLENEFLTNHYVLVCPTSDLADNLENWRPPTFAELNQADGQKLVYLQRQMGGSYGYTLGHMEDGYYRPTRNQGRAHFVVMSDAPSRSLPGRRSLHHGAFGQNVLYENGRIRFIVWDDNESFGQSVGAGDNPFLNLNGYVEAGVGVDDSVLGASATPPFVQLAD